MSKHVCSTSSGSRSVYHPLDETNEEIRLIEIVQGTTMSMVECKLQTVSLKDKPVFTALSYVWGDPTVTEDILLGNQQLPVTSNLANALKFVTGNWKQAFPGRNSQTFRLWADAICINQVDMKERDSQVQLMRSLYSEAELVVAWLGSEDDFVEDALDAFNTISREIAIVNADNNDLAWLEKYSSWCKPSENPAESKPWHPMTRLGYIPYWRRVWIFQELVLARRIVFSHRSTITQFTDMKKAVEWHEKVQKGLLSGSIKIPSFLDPEVYDILADSKRFSMDISIKRIVMVRDLLTLRTLPQEAILGRDRRVLWQIFFLCKDLHATDPRDHIYGLLGLTQCSIIPDYENKDVSAVCSDFVSASLEDTKMLLFMGYAGIGIAEGSNDKSLPSWAPNFEMVSHLGAQYRWFDRGRSDEGLFDDFQDFTILLGSELHTVAFMGPRIEKSHAQISGKAWEDGRGFELLLDLVKRKDAFAIHPLNAILHALSATDLDESGNFTIETAFAFLQCCLIGLNGLEVEESSLSVEERFKQFNFSPILTEKFLAEFSAIFPVNTGSSRTEYIQIFLRCLQELSRNSFNRTLKIREEFFRSTRHHCFAEMGSGYLGLVPRCSLVGDVVAIVNGCGVPVVLRKKDDHYIHVGTCYVHGLMNGEVLDMLVADMDLMQKIEIW